MIYGELGRFPLEIRVKLRMIAFWSKLVLNENKLSSVSIGKCRFEVLNLVIQILECSDNLSK
jgi:hypothetical protein